MELTITLLNAFVNDMKWCNKVANLLGPDWDADGSEVMSFIWSKIYDTWGEHGADFVSDYIDDKEPFVLDSDGEYIYATNINVLVAILNEFFLVKEEDKEED